MPRGARNDVQFELYVNKVIKKAVWEVADKTLKELVDYVNVNWYYNSPARSSESEYERTMDFLDSLVKNPIRQEMRSYVTEIFSNPNKIFNNFQSGFFNSHMSLDGETTHNGVDISELMVGIIEDGTSSPYAPHGGIQMFKATDKWLSANLTRMMKSVFKRYGLKLMGGKGRSFK